MKLGRVWILSALVLVFGFAGGFVIGTFSDDLLRSLKIIPPKIRVLVEDRRLFPENLRALLEKHSGLQLEVQAFTDATSLESMTPYFDIFLGQSCLLEHLDFESEDLIAEFSAEKNISPDFLTFGQKKNFVLPLLWRFQKETGFQIISIRMKKSDHSSAHTLIKSWMQKDFIQRWSETTDLATTFMTLDESSLEPELKASWLRKIPLNKLILEEKACQKWVKDSPAEAPNR